MSKIKQALALVDQGTNPHAAAVQVGIAAGSVYRKLKQIREKKAGRCPHCGAPTDAAGRYVAMTGD